MLSRGVKVYVLKNTKLIKDARMNDNLEKSDENDAAILSKITLNCYREVF